MTGKQRPSRWLTLNTLSVVVVGMVLPWSPLAGLLGFTPLPLPFLLFLGLSTITYLLLVEIDVSFLRSRGDIGSTRMERWYEAGFR